ncbi:MAG: hypothetical protein ACRC6X_02945, partial [Culicoidibacterales bacterium]
IGSNYFNGFNPTNKGKITVIETKRFALGTNCVEHQIELIKKYISKPINAKLKNEPIQIISQASYF